MTARFTYRRATGYGWDVYLDGVWVAWTAGDRDDALALAADIGRPIPPATTQETR